MALINKDIRYVNRDFNSLKKALIDFSKNYFLEDNVIKFENFLETVLIKKSIGGEWEQYNYPQLQKEIILYIRNQILKKNNII